ncbi:hypothetical protein TRAPUB_5528 [Trametes pubescens]|uniref:Uncharacterized protein n=1 Tax=Trametes pubescens TaxID=154538 RepID=A0A1M2V871_TRAPU|nr:hypothetical protein TRAPUB_5528 [Trametes pubescens]
MHRTTPLDELPRPFEIIFGTMELCAKSPAKEVLTCEFTRRATATVFDPATISLPFNNLPFLYLRRDLFLHSIRSGPGRRRCYVLKNPNRCLICPGPCDFGHRYGPDVDVLRYCYRCEKWFHAKCLDLVADERVDELLAHDLGWRLPNNSTRTEFLWWFLVSGPIERKPLCVVDPSRPATLDKTGKPIVKQDFIPTGWEMYVHFARNYHTQYNANGPPANIDWWIHNVGFPPLMSLKSHMMHRFEKVKRYQCPQCHACI